MTYRSRTTLHIVVIAAACLVVMGRQLAEPGVYSCIREDTIYYLNWVRQVAEGMASGLYYPRWMADSHAGYGNPVFVYYPPLVTFSTSVLFLATGNMAISAVLVKLIGVLLSGLFMYRFLLKLYSPRAALAGAVLYVLMPYRVYEMYFLGVHASKLTYVFYPLILHYLHDTLLSERKPRSMALLGLSFGLLCMTHILYGYMFLYVMAVYAIAVSERGYVLRGAAYASLGVLLGLAVTGVYVIPALMERGYVHFDFLTTRDAFLFYKNYLFGQGGDKAHWFYGYLSMTVVTTAGLGVSLLLTGWPGHSGLPKKAVYAFGLAFAFALLMTTSLSRPVWDYVPGMKFVQFPTRWSSPLVFCSAALAAYGVDGWSMHGKRTIKLITAAIACVFVFWGGWYVYDSVSRGCVFTNSDMTALPSDMDVYEYVPADVSLEWLKNIDKMDKVPRLTLYEDGKNAKLKVREWSPEVRVFSYSSRRGGILRVKTFYYPGWRAFGDGRELTVRPEPVSGAILIDAPAGSYYIRLCLTDTPLRRAALIVSLAGLAVTAILFVTGRRKRMAQG